MSFFLTYDKFMSSQRHAFAHARDKKGVCNRQESKVLTETEVLGVKKYDRLIRERGESRINAGNKVCNSTVRLIFFRCLKGNLNEDDFLMVFWVFVEKCLKREKFMAYTLNGLVNLLVVVEKWDSPELRRACHDRQQVSHLHTGLSGFEPIAQLQHHACQVFHSITIPERTSKNITHLFSLRALTSMPTGNTPTSTK